MRGSELSEARDARKRDDVADVGHSRHELNHPLKAQTEARVGNRAVAPEVHVPPVAILRQARLSVDDFVALLD